MTPEEARRLLDGTTPGPWRVDPEHSGEVLSPKHHWLASTYETGAGFTADELARAQADATLIAAAPTLAAMLAGMRAEYMALNRADENGEWHQVTPWSTEWPFRPGHTPDPRFDKVIRRYVTTEEEA